MAAAHINPVVADADINKLKTIHEEARFFQIDCKKRAEFKILDFLGSDIMHNVKLLFTEVLVEKSNRFNRNMPVRCTDIINMISESKILLLDSESGGGKSTIILDSLNDWSEGGGKMNTSGYSLLLPMIFRNSHLSCVGDLIGELIPSIGTVMGKDDIINCIADPSLKILFLCDGYEDVNENSEKLFLEICNLTKTYKHIKALVTSRPEAVPGLYRILHGKLEIDHLKIKGIHASKRKEFLEKYHNELVNTGMSHESTDGLLNFYDSCSAHHQDLYRQPINLVMLAFLWAKASQQVASIKSAAGLYMEISKILTDKFVNRISEKTEVRMSLSFMKKLESLISRFEEKVFHVSLVALKCDRIYIDTEGVDRLMDVCKDWDELYLEELQGAYLLTRLEWKVRLVKTLEVPHKGLLDFYAANYIAFKLSNGGERIRDIMLNLYGNSKDQLEREIAKYQNVFQLLGGILALKYPNLVQEHSQDIIDILIKTGIRHNTQWYTVYTDLAVNDKTAEKFANLIAPHLDLNNFIILDSDVEPLSILLKYIDIDTVTLDISIRAMPAQVTNLITFLTNKECKIILNKRSDLSNVLIDILRNKQYEITISEITDDHVNLWNSGNTPFAKIISENLNIKKNPLLLPLPFLAHCTTKRLDPWCQKHLWRNLHSAAPDMSRSTETHLYTAVNTITTLPSTVEDLFLGLLKDVNTGLAVDPGISNLTHQCPNLDYLRIHLRSGTLSAHLPRLPDKSTRLYLSQINTNEDIQWATQTAKTLQPASGYSVLIMPSCGLSIDMLLQLVFKCKDVTVDYAVVVSSSHTSAEETLLDQATRMVWSNCVLHWYQNDDDLNSTFRGDCW